MSRVTCVILTSITKLNLALSLETREWDSRAIHSLRASHSRHPARDTPYTRTNPLSQAQFNCCSINPENWDSSIRHCLNKGLLVVVHVDQSLFVPVTRVTLLPSVTKRVFRDIPSTSQYNFRRCGRPTHFLCAQLCNVIQCEHLSQQNTY